ncbi:MAG: TonB-dependent receptor [Bacteroidales bacterium]|nr:TonB-dependent receptor [Bacteroidales bacterium]
MKRTLASILGCLLLSVSLFAAKQPQLNITGSVIDQSGSPMGFATVYLSSSEGKVIAGTATEEDGRFTLKAVPGDYTLTVSLIGYKDNSREISLSTPGLELPPITLEEDSQLLEGASVQAIMPKTKLTGEGLQTSVRGSVLENAGSANDVLAKTPGMIKSQNGLEVIGKGSPLVYINGRKVTDSSELDRLRSNEIQSIEVITNPGAQYDATVKSVVRIRTIRRQGDGFGFNIDASDTQSLRWAKGNDPFGSVNVNYRTGGVDLFGGVNYAHNTSRQISDIEKTTFGKTLFEDKGDLVNEYIGQTMYGEGGINWQIADNHFLGGKIEWGRHLAYDVHSVLNDNVFIDGVQTDKLSTDSRDSLGDIIPRNIGGNIYYNGLVGGKLGIDVNLDYYGTSDGSTSVSKETSSMTHDAEVRSQSENSGKMYAAKAVLSYPIWKGQLQAGTEETFSRRNDDYTISGVSIPASQSRVKEDNVAGFASYAFYLEKFGQMSAGLRYEHVRYSYEDLITPDNSLSRKYGNWFPNLSYAGMAGPVQIMLSYSVKTRRPNYAQLYNAIRYNNRYIWQSGNAQLQPEISHNLGLTTVWKFITFMANYSRTDDAIMTWSSPYNDEGVVLVKPRNIETPFRLMTVVMNFTPTIGPWTMNYTLAAMPQWLTINAPDPREPSGIRVTRFNGKPVFVAQLFNTFTVKGGWQFELGGMFQSKGYSQNIYMKSMYFDLSAAIQKTLLKDKSLVLRLEGSDLAGLARTNVDTDFGSHTIRQTNMMDTQRVKFSVRYSFNAAQSKYRGTGAGSEEKARM